jgi:hypothetical protein
MIHIYKYYACSNNWRNAALLALAIASGCAGPNQAAQVAQRFSYAQLTGSQREATLPKLTHLPVVIHFKQGERIPVELRLDSSLTQLEAPNLTLVAKRDFYLLLRADAGPMLSADGVDFELDNKNYFAFAFKVERDAPTALHVVLGVRPEPKAPPPR